MLNLRKNDGIVVNEHFTKIRTHMMATSTAHPSHLASVYLPDASEQLGGGQVRSFLQLVEVWPYLKEEAIQFQ